MFAHDKVKSNFYIYYKLFLWYNSLTREMKKHIAFLISLVVCMGGFAAMAADFQVKKASSVKKQEKSGLESIASNSLVPGVVGLISNVTALTKQQKELAAECMPSSTELSWVNSMVREYAKIGEITAESMFTKIDQAKCVGETYSYSVSVVGNSGEKPCADYNKEQDVIWAGYPEASTGTYCADGSLDMKLCPSSKKKQVSNVYAVFGAINFSQEDFTEDEINMYSKMMEKADKCAPEKISQRNREAYASFLKATITGAGQTTNTAGVWDAIGNLTQSGGGLSGLGSLAPTVTQFLDK